MAAATYRPLEVTLTSAKDLKDVNFFSKMDIYAIVTISGDRRTKQRTPADHGGHKSPTWNKVLRFSVPDSPDRGGLVLQIRLRSERAFGDRDVGEVHIPIRELEPGDKSAKFLSYQVRRPSGRPKGVLNISYKYGDAVAAPPPYHVGYAAAPHVPGAYLPPHVYPPPASAKANEPVMAYPAGASTAYPQPFKAGIAAPYPAAGPGYPQYPPPPPYGYGYRPPTYGYPPAQPGYGYGGYGAQPVVQQPQRKNKFGMGMGAGLLGGALGGLLIGDMISDAAAYDAGYDAGFDDIGGFDF